MLEGKKELETFLAPGGVERRDLTQHILQMQEMGAQDRIRFLFIPPDIFRYEQLEQMWDLSGSEPRPLFRNVLTIQSDREHWLTDELNHSAIVDRSGGRLNLQEGSTHYPLQSILRNFAEFPPGAQVAEFSRLLNIEQLSEDLVIYTISLAQPGSNPEASLLTIGYRPTAPTSDISHMIFFGARPDRAIVFEFQDWKNVLPAIRRPFYISMNIFDPKGATHDEFVRTWNVLAVRDKYMATARTLKFDIEIPESEFTYEPPQDYTVLERMEDGSLVAIFDPVEEENRRRRQEAAESRAAEAQDRRLQRIDARVGGANFWGRAGIYVGIFGGICLILAAFYYTRRRKG